ncbi:SDR family NAD(P)-dependent oxidoreductase [Halorarum halobium]|uniref:SDR family NAD(P)-dependent oxidoreductase n=1 Tax=Halorarum halobium TaxID=3075121 RepID=UPI0028A5FD26|nr:SDR family oxidoreductase [Halobaculum sp. XH14]
MANLNGERIVVTGASRGLGRSMALRLSAEGASVALVARDGDELTAVAADADGETLVAPADVRDADSVSRAVERTVDAFGGIDTLVNNAAVGLLSLGKDGKLLGDVTEDEWELVLDTNLTGVFRFSKATLPHMLDGGSGNVVNVSSGLAEKPAPRFGPYAASKAGVEALTRTMAAEYDEAGINVNSLGPGGRVNTAFWDHLPDEERESILQPDVMDEAAVLLAGQGPEGVSGESLAAPAWERRLG